MIQIVVLLEIKNKVLLTEFENKAIEIMKRYEGKLISAFETNKEESTSCNINEIHYLEFPSIKQFTNYKRDSELLGMSELRNEAILNTTIYVSEKTINYT